MTQRDRRNSQREVTVVNGVMCRATFADGATVTGLVSDCSATGARINTPLPQTRIATPAVLLFMFPTDECVEYRATIAYVDTKQGFFGVRYESEPISVSVHPPDAPNE